MAAESPTTDYMERDNSRPQRRCFCCSLGLGLIITGAVLAVIGLLYGTILPPVIDNVVKDGVVTCDASEGNDEDFLDPYGDCKDCNPYYYKLYMMNATNAESYLAGDASTLQVREMGPYTYRRREIKLDVKFLDDGNRVTYKMYSYHTYVPELSCDGCSDTDEVVTMDSSYMSVIAGAGGEMAFLVRLALGSFASGSNTSAVLSLVAQNGQQMMRWINGLNSMDPEAMRVVTNNSAVLSFLATGPAAIANMSLTGFAYNGIFNKRPVSRWALGFPSLLAGLGLGSNYINRCAVRGGLNEQCAACSNSTTPECLAIWGECKRCTRGAQVVALNDETCAIVQATYAAAYGDEEAATFAASTCQLCSAFGLCAAPIPGIVESSGRDFSVTPPNASILTSYTMRTGCDDKNFIHEYEEFEGYRATALWADLGDRRNPNLSELIAFNTYGNCAAPTANLTCIPVFGNDGTGVAPGGVSITGFKDDITQPNTTIYMKQGRQNVTILNQYEEVEYKDITLHRFRPSTSLLSRTVTNAKKGTGSPVDGVQSMSFTRGFLVYMSYPMYLYGDDSLMTNVQISLLDGVQVSRATLYESDGRLLPQYTDRFETFMDIEAGTGRTMRALKRLMASFALSRSNSNSSLVMSDILFPTLQSEVLIPIYWGNEGSTIKDSRVDDYDSIVMLLDSMLPVLIAGIVVGLLISGIGAFFMRSRRQQAKKV
ncbi:croquemort-like mating [Plasmopara halstedii]|uniref:Croquemort-like mating n=1 Tax=Plasmopara halstedii TaxID=4781 RepID=A0A0P1B382_PLAHL|nr:croquemort-like mating [Plasmopara halstedii]CEG48622.1 croquemort-like mating [Plasmopara halstedii]|eukprot:XP_024584991.1 croquemort-like mating [Plasmopara halstedii]